MLKTCGKIKASSTGSANVSRQYLNLLEIYFELYLNEIDKLLRLGLIKQYHTNTNNVKSLKGKLDFSGNIKRNTVHKERFYTTHQVYNKNHKLHQILAVANNIVSNFTRGTRLSNLSSKINLSFPYVQKIQVNKKIILNLKLNRKSASYSYALELAQLIILNYSPNIKGGNEKMISLLFDMNQLWEEYVLVKLRKHIVQNNLNWQIISQDSKSFIKGHRLKPDIILKNMNAKNEIIVIDTKWKLGNEHINIQDLRQVYTYAKYWEANKVMLLYPGNYQSSKFNKYLDSFEHHCKIGFVSVVDNNSNLDTQIGKNIMTLLNDNL
jgi:5-methylcytosine-specific restriction enzyme subunit McrC